MAPSTRPAATDAHPAEDSGGPRRRLGRALAGAGLAATAWVGALATNRSLRRVAGPSMLPGLRPGDLLLTVPRRRGLPPRGDLVVASVGGTTAVKRLVGLPGDDVVLLDGHLHVDGSWWQLPGAVLVDEDHRWRVGADEVVLLGDNRAASTDSRTAGPVRLVEVARVVVASVRPPRRLGAGVGMRRLPGPRRREAVRIVTLDPDDRVLLFRVADVDGVEPDWWETPGGGLQPGEDVMAAARRELAEEVGPVDCELVDLDHVAGRDSSIWGAPLRRIETTVATRLPTDEVRADGWTDGEHRDIVDWHWFTRDELTALTAATYPVGVRDLVDRARTLV